MQHTVRILLFLIYNNKASIKNFCIIIISNIIVDFAII